MLGSRKNIIILHGRDATKEMLLEAIKIDKLVYPSKYETIPEYLIKWYKKNDDIITLVCDENKVIGYICVMPISDNLYKDIKNGTVEQDITIPVEEVSQYLNQGTYNLYVFSIVVHPDYQGKGIFKYLLRGLHQNLTRLIEKDIILVNIIGDAVSDGGARALMRIGLEKIGDSNHHSTIYEGDVNKFLGKYKF